MHLRGSDEGSQYSSSEEDPTYYQHITNNTNKYLQHSASTNIQNKYQNIKINSPKEPHRFSLQTHTFGSTSPLSNPKFKKQQSEKQQSTQNHEDNQLERFKLLLENQIEKNRQLQKQLFLRQKQLMDIRSQQRPIKKIMPNRMLSPPPNLKMQQIKLVQKQLDQLKKQVEQNASIKYKYQESKKQISKLKKINKKYKQFVDAIALSLGIVTESQPPKGINQTWKAWNNVFKDIAKNQHNI